MEFSLVNGERRQPEPKLQGQCPACLSSTRSKCGRMVMWHWAHVSLQHCDPWWENETEWHRSWKSLYPEDWRERVHFDTATGMKHVADVKTGSGLVIEFQNSPMSHDERDQRESFYEKMLWVVNAKKFAQNFRILDRLPPPDSELVRDLVFFPALPDSKFRAFWRPSENPDHKKEKMVQIHNISQISHEIDRFYAGHHFFHWKRERDVWLSSKSPVFLDFGDEFVWQLIKYDYRGLRCVQRITKKSFVETGLSQRSV